MLAEEDAEPDYVGLLHEMCDDFDGFQQRGHFPLGTQVRDPSQFVLVYGLNRHAHYMISRCMPMLTESTIAAVPILRSVFECGVMAQWLLWVRGSELGLMEECRRQQAAMIENLHRSAAPHFREQAAKLGRVHAEKLPALSEEQHGPSVKFQAMCEAFDGSADLYSNYRHLCGYTHAGVPLASWLVFDSTDPRQFFTVQLVGRIALLALGWSSRAFDDLVAESPLSNFFDGVEQRSQLPTRLRIKDTVQVVT